MELFMDRYGGIITLVLAGILTLLATLFFLNDSKMSKRIAYLEGCCEQVQERLESTSVADEETIRAAVESKMEAFRTQQAEMVSKEIEAERESLKEEIRAEIETEVMESVKVQMEESRKARQKQPEKATLQRRTHRRASQRIRPPLKHKALHRPAGIAHPSRQMIRMISTLW